MARADALAGNVAALMDAAGRAVARAVLRRYRPCRTLVLAGPGNNGGDGVVAARYLREAGWNASVATLATATVEQVRRADLVIDALFGAGLSRDLGEPAISLLQAARRIVAVDVPSGLDGATGQARGFAPQAELTVTFFRKKPGHLLLPGRALCGELLLRDIGLPASVLDTVKPQTWENTAPALPQRDTSAHKFSAGEVTILCGAMPGAARLAATAARRAGAGIVSLAVDAPLLLPEPGILLRTGPLLDDPRRQTFVVGPGLGVERAAAALALLTPSGRKLVADADALTACAGAPERLRGVAVITPHAAEFARVFGPPRAGKLTAARKAAAQTGAVVVFKGADTVIAAPDGRAAINANAPPWLATGGTGDVLAGVIAALLAQGLKPFEAACAGVWLHGAAATTLGPGLLAEDLPAAIARQMAL
jgi:NAD(P)H-hydrate repair Nnr-like enzyme with NAD(P)H-hydrate dehydratase domain/NAD(P)H-hydrate repair Nnr-like enzyme with NAD(P)H-hydrate epimerase domain